MKRFKIITIIFLFIFLFNIEVNASSTYMRGIVKKSSTIRTEANSSSKALKNDEGYTVTLYNPEAVEVLSEEGAFYKIKFLYSGFLYEGYITKDNIIVTTYTTDDVYEQNLVSLGFPLDYAKRLAILHAIHPNWNFTPSFTGGTAQGMDFYTAVKGEASVVARNLISGSNTTLRSTADGAYKNGEWISLSGKGWYAASEQTIAYFLDPRNFLDESHVFMFENLGYNPITQTKDTVNKILAPTFMNNPFICIEGANNCVLGTNYYVDTFMKAALDKKVSPVHLASRVVQEQGSKGSVLSLGQGYNGEYIGYYNFFNINASGITDADVILNGLKHAYNKNWNNQHVSIYDGSNLIANNYVGRGQSTAYYQKFNTITPSYYGNQYMQNVEAPYSESYTTYKSYYNSYSTVEEWDVAVYDFLIPIYSNMGTSTSLDSSFNSDSTLKTLDIAECRLNPEFQSSAYEYECYAKNDINELNVNAVATNPNAKVENSGKITITDNEMKLEVKVTAVNGSYSIYVINVHRIETDGYTPTEILNGIGMKVDANYASNVEVGSDVSNIINSIKNKYFFAEIKITDENGVELTDGLIKTGYTITIVNAGVSSEFKVVVYGDINNDGLIDIVDLLKVRQHLVGYTTLKDASLKASDLNKDNTVDIVDLLLVRKFLLGEYTINQG